MSTVLGILAFFVILAVLILVHEAGHFTFAKLMGVRVEEFGLGFPPRIKAWRRGETLYTLNAIPIGGFVKMLGENGEENDPASFGSKPPWQRLVILASGPIMNLALAVLLFFVTFMVGEPQGLTEITGISPNSPAAQIHLRSGDRIVSVNGTSITYTDELRTQVDRYLGRPMRLGVEHHGRIMVKVVVPRVHPPPGQGAIGVTLGRTVLVGHGLAGSFTMALQQVGTAIASIPPLLQSISQHGARDISGPIGIAHDTTQVVQNVPSSGIGLIVYWMAFLSTSLGVLNLLPIPALDGGRIAFVVVSWVRRRNLDPQVEGIIHMVGMVVLLLLILAVSYQDIVRWVSGGTF